MQTETSNTDMSATPASQTTVISNAPTTAAATTSSEIIPNVQTLLQATRLAIKEDRPIQMDYYVDTATGRAFLGEDVTSKTRVLMKAKDEYTSTVMKMYKTGDDFIIMTENSIYIVSGKMQKKKINMASLQSEYDNL
jgi:hypothetical protein